MFLTPLLHWSLKSTYRIPLIRRRIRKNCEDCNKQSGTRMMTAQNCWKDEISQGLMYRPTATLKELLEYLVYSSHVWSFPHEERKTPNKHLSLPKCVLRSDYTNVELFKKICLAQNQHSLSPEEHHSPQWSMVVAASSMIQSYRATHLGLWDRES